MLANRTAQKIAAVKAAPSDILEWQALSSHDYWVYRSLTRSGNMSNLGKFKSDARAFTFVADIYKESRVQMYVSDETKNALPNDLPASKLFEYQRLAPDVWQATIPLAGGQATTNALYEIFSYFGFGVVL